MPAPDDRPNAARTYDLLLRGAADAGYSTAADRAAARTLLEMDPGAIDRARANRRFTTTVARRAAEAGVRQFLDLGAGLPAEPSVHGEARNIIPDARVVYVDHDPLTTDARDAFGCGDCCETVTADIDDPETVLASVPLNLGEPVAVILGSVIQLLKDPRRAIAAYREAIAPGSWLAISAVTYYDAGLLRRVEEMAGRPIRNNALADLTTAFAGMRMVHPGISEVEFWLAGIRYEPGGKDGAMLAGAAVKVLGGHEPQRQAGASGVHHGVAVPEALLERLGGGGELGDHLLNQRVGVRDLHCDEELSLGVPVREGFGGALDRRFVSADQLSVTVIERAGSRRGFHAVPLPWGPPGTPLPGRTARRRAEKVK